MNPVQIKILDKVDLAIRWDDNSDIKINLKKLRRLCPCATCVTNREGQSKSYIPLFFQDQITISKIEVVGNYAIQITWKDGHSTGIYEYPYLKNLAKDL